MTKKIILYLMLLGLTTQYSFSQNYRIHVKPVGATSWKYADIKGNIVINCDYPVSYQFSPDGIAVGYYPKKNLYVLINQNGEQIKTEIEDFQLKSVMGYGAHGYYNGIIGIQVKGKWGCLDASGKAVIQPKYDNISEFNNGIGIARIEKNFFIVDKTGKETPILNKDIIDITHFEENLAPYTSKDHKKGFINTNGEIAIQAQFASVGYFTNGLAWAKAAEGQYGFINQKGEWVIKPIYTAVNEFEKESGLARVKSGTSWSYINDKGDIITLNASETLYDFKEGLSKGKKGLLFGFYNNKGEWVIQPQFQAIDDFNNGYAVAKQNNLWGVINKKGEWVIKPTFEGIKSVIEIK